MKENQDKLIVALDVSTKEEAIQLCQDLKDSVGVFKIGLELYLSQGKGIVNIINAFGKEVFLDLKLYDIPNTTKGAVAAIVEMGVDMFTIHTSGGRAMITEVAKEAARVAEDKGLKRPKVLGVTVLTSFEEKDMKELGVERKIEEQVVSLAKLGLEAGVDGVVASPHEIEILRKNLGEDFLIVAPGIRLKGDDSGDQKRFLTPQEAIEKGASHIVVGRSIIKAASPKEAADKIVRAIGGTA